MDPRQLAPLIALKQVPRIGGSMAAFLILVSSACVASTAPNSPSYVVRVSPAAYVSIDSISGYLRFGSHSRQLWDDERSAQRNDILRCVTLINTQPFQERLRALNRSRVEIEGFPVEDVLSDMIDIGACNRRGFYVRDVRALTR